MEVVPSMDSRRICDQKGFTFTPNIPCTAYKISMGSGIHRMANAGRIRFAGHVIKIHQRNDLKIKKNYSWIFLEIIPGILSFKKLKNLEISPVWSRDYHIN